MKIKNDRELGREIFLTGEYVRYFRPDDDRNPFSGIYEQKRADTLNIIAAINSSRKILDIGGGMGRISIALAASGTKSITLADISSDMLKLAASGRGKTAQMDLINTDAHKLPFRDNIFDCIVALDLLCHLQYPEEALNEFYRVLTDRGTLILDSTNSNPLWTLFYPKYLGKNPINWIRTIKCHGVLPGWDKIVRHYTKSRFFAMLRNAGFMITDNIDYGPSICPKWHLAVSRKGGGTGIDNEDTAG